MHPIGVHLLCTGLLGELETTVTQIHIQYFVALRRRERRAESHHDRSEVHEERITGVGLPEIGQLAGPQFTTTCDGGKKSSEIKGGSLI